jgi:hypothetical protein
MSASFDPKFIHFSTAAGSSLLTGLVSYWKLNETGAGANAVDEKGLNTLTNNSATTNQSGKLGTSFSFASASTSNLDTSATSYNLTSAFTISIWVKTSSSGLYKFAVSNYTDPDGWCMGMDDSGHLDFEVGSAYVTSVATINTNAWVHLVGVWSGGAVTAFVNGTKSTGSSVASVSYPSNHFKIGNREASYYWDGNLDEVGIWNRALTDGEVASLYNSGTGVTYPFS